MSNGSVTPRRSLRAVPPAGRGAEPADAPERQRAERRPLLGGVRRAFSRSAVIPEGRAPAAVRRRERLYRWALVAADVLAAGAAVLAAVVVLGEGTSLTLAAALPLPLIVWMSKVAGLYDRDDHLLKKTTLDEAPSVLQVATLYTLLTWLAEDLLFRGGLEQSQVLALWVLLVGLMLVGRLTARRVARSLTPGEQCVVIGDEEAAAWLDAKLASSSTVDASLLGRVPLGGGGDEPPLPPGPGGPPLLGGFEELGLILAAHDVDRVIIAPATSDSELILAVIRLVKSLGLKVTVLPRLFEVVGSSVEFDELDGTTLLGLRRYGLTRSSRVLKRSVDAVGGALALVVLSPALLAIALAVKLTSPGPVLFRQLRRGRHGAVFSMLKFRTMAVDAEQRQEELGHLNEAIGFFKIENDPRVTGVGRFLRRSSLDELPQLVNVVRGDMSLVGPRPLPLREDDRIEGWERTRLQLHPGMTGLWQIFGSSRIPMHEMIKIDYLYGANWSLWLDMKILLRTVPYVVGRRGR